MGSRKNIAQMGDAWSLRFSARIQRFSMVLYLLVLYLAPRKGKQHCASARVKASSPQLKGRVPKVTVWVALSQLATS